MRTKLIPFFFAIVPLAVLLGCASSGSRPRVYNESQAGQMISEQKGEIIGVQDVVIKARSRQAGSPGAGSQIGSAAVVGAVLGSPLHAVAAAGGVIGSIAGANMDNTRGEELTILLKDGRTVVVVQERGETPYAIGDRVKLLSGSGTIYESGSTRVERDDVYARKD